MVEFVFPVRLFHTMCPDTMKSPLLIGFCAVVPTTHLLVYAFVMVQIFLSHSFQLDFIYEWLMTKGLCSCALQFKTC